MGRVTVHLTGSPAETEELGVRLAADLTAGDVVLLEGDLAAGKTVFVRGLVRGLGGQPQAVTSPTFVILQSYDVAAPGLTTLHHLDLYRVSDDTAQLREIGVEELLSEPGSAVAVEWPRSSLLHWLPPGAHVWRVGLEVADDSERRIRVLAPE
jgi:tRNA threonylcarbamoyladenosine biosynthesis protein TsaE